MDIYERTKYSQNHCKVLADIADVADDRKALNLQFFVSCLPFFLSLLLISQSVLALNQVPPLHNDQLVFSQQSVQNGDAARQKKIINVIQTQLKAFRDDDKLTAFAQASPAIRRQLVNADRFMAMVRFHYTPVYRPRSVSFLELESGDHYHIQHLLIIGPDGYSWDAYYVMEQMSSGEWRIAGVKLLKREDIPV